jgi:HEPN domain-containing protein
MVWRVVVATEITPDARRALQRAGIVHISGHALPGMTSSTVVVEAPSEPEARRRVAEALGVPETFIRDVQQTPVWVYAPVGRADVDAFTGASSAEDGVEIVEQESPEERFEVAFELPQGPVDEIFTEARRRYALICERAGIEVPDPLELRASGFEVFLEDQRRRDSELLNRADELFEQGHNDLAVIVAQTACEVLVADAMRTLLEGHASDGLFPWLIGRISSYSLVDDATRDLWNKLTQTEIQRQDWWSAYREHVRRRNGIVYAGERVDGDAARSSLDAARELFTFIDATVRSDDS